MRGIEEGDSGEKALGRERDCADIRRSRGTQAMRREGKGRLMRKSWKLGTAVMALLLTFGTLLPVATLTAASPMTPDEQVMASTAPTDPYFFKDTGHYLSGRFRQYWEDH